MYISICSRPSNYHPRCEILAIRSLRDHADSTLELATACTTPWPIFAGAPADIRDFADKNLGEYDIRERVGNAIEMAIVGNAKRFIKSSACQSVIGLSMITTSCFVVD